MDKIFLNELKVETVIGIWEWERKIRQTVVIDLEMSADIAKAAATDSVDDTLNYKSVAKRIQQFVGDSSFQLVETLAEKIAAIVRDEFDVPTEAYAMGVFAKARSSGYLEWNYQWVNDIDAGEELLLIARSSSGRSVIAIPGTGPRGFFPIWKVDFAYSDSLAAGSGGAGPGTPAAALNVPLSD